MNYSDLLFESFKPSIKQCQNFAEDFLGFHSWYKRLDRVNGNRFIFFLDPEDAPAGNKSPGDLRPFHFNHGTKEYREDYVQRYGCINYAILDVRAQLRATIEFRGAKIIIPEELLQKQACILFPYCYNAASRYMAMPELVELLIAGWAQSDEHALYAENRPFISSALQRWQQLKESRDESTASSSDLKVFYASLLLEEVQKVNQVVKAILGDK